MLFIVNIIASFILNINSEYIVLFSGIIKTIDKCITLNYQMQDSMFQTSKKLTILKENIF